MKTDGDMARLLSACFLVGLAVTCRALFNVARLYCTSFDMIGMMLQQLREHAAQSQSTSVLPSRTRLLLRGDKIYSTFRNTYCVLRKPSA